TLFPYTTLFRSVDAVRKRITYVPQRSATDWDFPINVFDTVLLGTYPHLRLFQRPGAIEREIARRALLRVDMEAFANRQIADLSGGQQQRVFIARALAQQADILLLDEPLMGIDAASEANIIEILTELCEAGKTVVMVHHDLSNIQHYFDHMIMINQHLIAQGSIHDVLTAQNLTKTFGANLLGHTESAVEFLNDLINNRNIAHRAITDVISGIVPGGVGSLIILRGLSLMCDATSHAVMPGIAVSFFFGANIFIGALVSGLLAAAGIGFVAANSRLKRDTSIGIVFTAFLAAGVILLAQTESSVSLQSVLFGDVLATLPSQMWQALIIAVVILTLVVLFYKHLQITTMDTEVAKAYGFPTRTINYAVLIGLAVVTVSAVQTVGVILVVAMLVTPAATAFLLSRKFSTMMWLAAGFGMLSSIAGMYFSYTLALQSGPAIVLVAF